MNVNEAREIGMWIGKAAKKLTGNPGMKGCIELAKREDKPLKYAAALYEFCKEFKN